jgi:predicted nucleotidyltransferase
MIDEKIKERIIDVLKAVKPEKIVLFGSYVYGVPSSDSDIDLLIIKNIKSTEVRNYRLNVKKLLWQEFKGDSIWFDVLVDSEKRITDRIKIGDLFYEEIYSKGKVIYA